MRITVVVHLAYQRSQFDDWIAAGTVFPEEIDSSRYDEEAQEEGYPWLGYISSLDTTWDVEFPSPSVFHPFQDEEIDFILESIKRALREHINSFDFSDH